jgi:hypothetical protein
MRLKRRASELEGSFCFLTQQISAVHKDLLTFQERTEQRFEQLNGSFSKFDGRFDLLEKEVRDLRKDMPDIVAHSMREVLSEHSRKARKT